MISTARSGCAGPNVMAGYANRPAETAAALTDDGWLRTGDGGYLDEEGYLFLTDRIKDMIVTGGENVYPIEVEEALSHHPAVAEVAVIGVPDERWGEAVKALVVARDGGVTRRRARRVRARAARRLQAPALDRAGRGPSPHAVREGPQARAARALPQRRRYHTTAVAAEASPAGGVALELRRHERADAAGGDLPAAGDARW